MDRTGDDEDEEDGRAEVQPFPSLPEPRYSRALERGLAILACFTSAHPVLGIADVADRLGMSRATTHRYMSTLVAQGYLQRDARKYRLGLGAVDLGMTTLGAMGLCNHARPDLQELAKRCRQTAEMAVLDGLEILVLESVSYARQGSRRAELVVRPGSRLPPYCTSMGKILLAYLPARQRERALAAMELVRHGPNTITNRTELAAQLGRVRDEGLAFNDEERIARSCAIAAPIRDETGDVVAAIDVTAHSGVLDVEDLADQFAGKLLAAAQRISKRLGWQG
ncbi:MAG TPA: IclR family transcriptional regulator [Solirubrobacteraceae bacterium]|nr:IclR family transcriptional regulator [Solirubrobacteraceae bacterium]